MSTALIRGYYGNQNTGDDAFFAVSAWAAREFCHCDRVCATSKKTRALQDAHVYPLFIPEKWRGTTRWNCWRETLAARRCDYVIWGGGSNFMKKPILDHASRVLDAAPGATAFAAGVSVGPFASSADESACRRVLSRLAFVGVRDRISWERARDLAPQTRVELTFDLAPLLPRARGIHALDACTRDLGVGIALCKDESHVGGDTGHEADRAAVVAEAVRSCAASGLLRKVTLMDFNGHPVFGNYELHCELASRIRDCVEVRHVRYNQDPLAVMRTVSRLEAIIATKLHSAVFAFCTQTPALILSYQEKCREWGSMVGVPADLILDVAELTPQRLRQQIERLMNRDSASASLPLADAERQALRNWSWLDS